MENNRNLFITLGLSVLILVAWQILYMNPRAAEQKRLQEIEAQRIAQTQQVQPGAAPAAPGQTPTATGVPGAPVTPGAVPGSTPSGVTMLNRDQAVAATQRVTIDTPSLTGSINLTGARLDDLRLKKYKETIDANSAIITLLNPQGLANGYFVEVGYTAPGDAQMGSTPGPDTVWTADSAKLTPTTPVTLTYTNEKGVVFKRLVSVDDNYMFKFTDTVTNGTAAPISIFNYGRVTRFDKPEHAAGYSVQEGPLGVFNIEGKDRLTEITYAKIEDEKQQKPGKTGSGWLGITDKYWGVAIVPSNKQQFDPTFAFYPAGATPAERQRFQSDYLSEAITVAPGASDTQETQVFAGAKEVNQVNTYAEERQIPMFDRLIDWGWYPFLTKPMFWVIDHLYKLLGNFGLAILATTVLAKLVFFPLANMSYKSMAKMKVVQPKMMEIRDKYADDKAKQQQAMMELYKTEKINPVAGCWPVLVQIPVFFALYKVLIVTLDMRHQPFFGWIHDLAAPDPTSIFNLFGLIPITLPHLLMLGVWPLIMGITMFLQMKMNPAPPDPTQAAIFNWMPVIFTFMMAGFPAGLVIYWAWNNTLSILQQAAIMKRMGAKVELWDNLKALFQKKPKPAQ